MKQYMASTYLFVARKSILAVLLFAVVVGSSGCGSSGGAGHVRTADDVYAEGVEEFNSGDYLEAQKLFDVIKLQYPASQYADDAQYYMAEINYKKGEYVLAAYNYNLLRRAFPNSQYAKEALYKASMSYLQLSPDQQREQSYTKQAIRSFSEFQAFYPDDSLAVESGKRIVELREKLAERDFATAQLYIKLDYPRAALIYFNQVISEFADTHFLEPAYVGRLKMQIRLKKLDDARETMRLYKQQFPQGEHREEVKQMAASL